MVSPQVLEDPVGVIASLVAERDPCLDRAVITKAVESTAGGRAKRRRLAQALMDRPQVLADGRSPAARAVADLLIGLRKAGVANISAPACAGCGRPLRTFQRRGEDWYCGVCGPVRDRAQHAASSGASTAATGTGGLAAPSARSALTAIARS